MQTQHNFFGGIQYSISLLLQHRNSIQSKQQSKQFYAQFPVSSRYFFCRIFMSSRFPTAVRARFFGREKRSEAGSIAITLLLHFPPAASNCYSQERIEAVDQDSRVNFLKQPLAASKKQPRKSELSHSTTSAVKQRILAVYRRRCSAICSDVIFLRVHKNPQQTKLTGPWGVLWSFFAG